jgi:hypothetical protein
MSTTPAVEIVKSTQDNVLALRQRVEAIEVRTPQDYIAVCNLVIEGRGFIKRWQGVFAETIRSAKEHLATVQNELKAKVTEADEVVGIAERKGETYKRAEREAAQREQQRLQQEAEARQRQKAAEEKREADRIAAEQRKAREAELEAQRKAGEIGKREEARLAKIAAEEEAKAKAFAAEQAKQTAAAVPTVKVEPNVPKVAGIKGRVNYRFEVVNASLIPRDYMKPDEVRIGELVRRIKDPEKAQQVIPGIRCWTEDSI